MSRSSRTLYVSNLPGHIHEREVEDIFYKQYGPIAHIDLKIPPRTPPVMHLLRRHCSYFQLLDLVFSAIYAMFVIQFEEARDAEDAIRGRDGYDFVGQRLRVQKN